MPQQQLSTFATDLGWFGLLGDGDHLVGLTFGHSSADEVRAAVRRCLSQDARMVETDWNTGLRQRMERYTHGEADDFRNVQLTYPKMTAFQQRILDETRQIGYGETLTYSQLAARAGSPGAARAVGNVMASNRLPLVIPCHRVVASGGKWGGYTAPQGVSLKQKLLAMEAETQSDLDQSKSFALSAC